MAKKTRRSKKSVKYAGVDPAYLARRWTVMKRAHRKVVLFNEEELSAIRLYCERFHVASLSALIRQATMQQVLRGLDESHPTLF